MSDGTIFADSTTRFIRWVEGLGTRSECSAGEALQEMLALYAAAMSLPVPRSPEPPAIPSPAEAYKLVFRVLPVDMFQCPDACLEVGVRDDINSFYFAREILSQTVQCLKSAAFDDSELHGRLFWNLWAEPMLKLVPPLQDYSIQEEKFGETVGSRQMSDEESDAVLSACIRFCRWHESLGDVEEVSSRQVLMAMLELYRVLLDAYLSGPYEILPEPEVPGMSVHQKSELWNAAYARQASAPLGFYYSDLDWHPDFLGSPALGDLADDLASIYSDLAEGLTFYTAGYRDYAAHELVFQFPIHIGCHHFPFAIRPLHLQLLMRERLKC